MLIECVEIDVLLSILCTRLSIYGAVNPNTRSIIGYDVFIYPILF